MDDIPLDETPPDPLRREPLGLSDAKRRVLDLLKRQGASTSSQLAKVLSLTRMAVHQHLQALEASGWVVAAQSAPRGRGRPSMRWQLSDRGSRQLFPDSHGELSVGLIDAARQAFGEEGLDRLIAVRSEQQVKAYRSRLEGAEDLRQRVERLAEQRSAEGYMAEVREGEDGDWILIEHHCPICEAAQRCMGICRAELTVFRQSLGEGVDIERTRHLLAGDDRCAYRIRAASVVAADGNAEEEAEDDVVGAMPRR